MFTTKVKTVPSRLIILYLARYSIIKDHFTILKPFSSLITSISAKLQTVEYNLIENVHNYCTRHFKIILMLTSQTFSNIFSISFEVNFMLSLSFLVLILAVQRSKLTMTIGRGPFFWNTRYIKSFNGRCKQFINAFGQSFSEF